MTINLNKIVQTASNFSHPINDKRILLKSVQDCVEIATPKNVVEVFNSLTKDFKKGEMLISPKFNGCHGVGVAYNGKVFFSHFPPFMQARMKSSIEKSLKDFDLNKGEAQVIFVTPVDSAAKKEAVFDEYLELIKEKFGDAINVEFLQYPNRSKGKTYKYIGVMGENGVLTNNLSAVSNK